MIPVMLAGPLPQALQQGQELWRGHEGPVYRYVGLAHVRKCLVEAVIQASEQRQPGHGHNLQVLQAQDAPC